MRYSLIVWDFDGTLADTLGDALSIWNEMAAEQGYRQVNDPHRLREMNVMEMVRDLGVPVWKLPALRKHFLARQKSFMDKIQLYSGLDEVFRQVAKVGGQMGIVSTNSQDNIQICLNANQVSQYFSFVLTCSRVFGKDRTLGQIIKKYAMDPRQVLYVGDEVRDIEAAQQASIDVAAVTWGMNSSRLLEQYSPTWLIEEPKQLAKLLTA